MTWIILTALATLVAVITYVIYRAFRAEKLDQLKQLEAESRGSGGSAERVRESLGNAAFTTFMIIGALFIAIAILTALRATVQVPSGSVGVVYEFGAIDGQIDEGFQIIAPWKGVKEASVQVQRVTFQGAEGDTRALASFSSESQELVIAVTVNYSVSPDAIQNLYRTVGPNWFDRLIPSRVHDIFKSETVKYRTVDIAPNRDNIARAALERLRTDLAPYSITVVDLLIDNIQLPKESTDAIERKQVAAQEALRAQEIVKQKEAEASQRRAEAQGIADANVIEAKGQAEANRELAASITPVLVQWQAVQKLSDKIQIALIPSGEGVIVDPATILAGQETTTP